MVLLKCGEKEAGKLAGPFLLVTSWLAFDRGEQALKCSSGFSPTQVYSCSFRMFLVCFRLILFLLWSRKMVLLLLSTFSKIPRL